uniref:Origin recognition complex subunit 5 n=1 Tax=Denticeps clupeoides TaxID=299321 RepID=A0AAY4DTS1_9TELE
MPLQLQHEGYSEEKLGLLAEKITCRETQASTLLALLGEPDHYTYPSIFIYGHHASGKSHVTECIMKELELPHVTVSCVECVSAGLLFEQVVMGLYGSEATALLPRSSSILDFVRVYKQLSSQEPSYQTRYIILDRAQLLRDMEANLLPGFLRLQELVDDNVTVIFLSEIVWDKFRPSTGCFEPVVLHFPDYNKGELHQILTLDSHPSYSPELYSSFINIMLGVFYSVCRDLRELRHLAALNFSKFCEPLERGEVKETDTHKLWKNIEPHLKKAMQTVYLREVSSGRCVSVPLSGLSAYAHVELPYYSKFLLIAAYLASYNPARTDRRFFLKHHGKLKKTNFMKKHEKTSNHLLGPKPFPLDRLLAIFYSVVDNRVAPTASVFSQISSLVTLQLLTQVGHDDQLDAPKYKCAVSLDFIQAIARTLSFDIVRYLYDFL